MISLRKGCSALTVAAVLLTGACGDSETTTEPLTPAKLEVVGPNAVSAPAGFPAPELLTVRLLTKSNVPVSRQLVRFTVTSGATLSNDSSFTDENGEARVGVTVGAPGDYTVTATVEGVAPVTFTATAVAPVAALLLAGEGNNQAGLANEPLAPLKAVVLKSDGTPAAGVTVNFAVTSGGGSVNPTSAVTDANGIATTTFTIGTSGTQTVTVTSAGLGAASFTATIANACIAARAMAIPETKNRSLEAADCTLPDGRFVEFFDISGAATAAVQLTQTSTAFTPAMTLYTANGVDSIGVHRPAAVAVGVLGTATFKAFLAAGTYRIGASSRTAPASGAYTISSAAATAVTNCERVFIGVGISIDQSIQSTDCTFTGDATQKSDLYRMYLRAGQTVRFTLQSIPATSGNIDMWLRIINPAGNTVLADIDCCASSTVEAGNFTATAAGFYFVEAGVFADPSVPALGAYAPSRARRQFRFRLWRSVLAASSASE
jgi:hypothetical protein